MQNNTKILEYNKSDSNQPLLETSLQFQVIIKQDNICNTYSPQNVKPSENSEFQWIKGWELGEGARERKR